MVSGLAALRTAASCAAVTRLSCTSTPCFQRCQRLQVSPRRPALFPAPQKPTSPATVIPLRQIPVAGLAPAFAAQQASRPFPVWTRFRVAQSLGQNQASGLADWVEDGIAAASALRSRASAITRTRLQQLTPRLATPGCRMEHGAGLAALQIQLTRA